MILAVVMVVGLLAGCGSNTAPASEPATSAAPADNAAAAAPAAAEEQSVVLRINNYYTDVVDTIRPTFNLIFWVWLPALILVTYVPFISMFFPSLL